MIRKTRPYREILLERLANPEMASHYLNASLEDSTEAFLKALFTVAQARQMSKVAKDAGVQRETLYRSLSEQGNPTLTTLLSILSAVGIDITTTPSKKQKIRSNGDGGPLIRAFPHHRQQDGMGIDPLFNDDERMATGNRGFRINNAALSGAYAASGARQ